MSTYYNEFDAYPAQWLRNLMDAGHISQGVVDETSIKEVMDDLSGYRRVHLFAGIGGWELALRIAGWPASLPVWTGSCPCQPFSSAGKRKAQSDDRHLWPDMLRLIRAGRPRYVFGEQVASAIGHGWLDGVFADLEAEGYACGAVVLGAHSVGAPHIRQRLWWVAYASQGRCHGLEERDGESQQHAAERAAYRLDTERPGLRGMAYAGRGRIQQQRAAREHPEATGGGQGEAQQRQRVRGDDWAGGAVDGVGAPTSIRCERERNQPEHCKPVQAGPHVACGDGKARRLAPGVAPLAHGLPRGLGEGSAGHTKFRKLAAASLKAAKRCRVGQLKGYGNAIVPQVAAEFIGAFMNAVGIKSGGAS